ncbi:hypothetical protein [Buchnera aphidicola]
MKNKKYNIKKKLKLKITSFTKIINKIKKIEKKNKIKNFFLKKKILF